MIKNRFSYAVFFEIILFEWTFYGDAVKHFLQTVPTIIALKSRENSFLQRLSMFKSRFDTKTVKFHKKYHVEHTIPPSRLCPVLDLSTNVSIAEKYIHV